MSKGMNKNTSIKTVKLIQGIGKEIDYSIIQFEFDELRPSHFNGVFGKYLPFTNGGWTST